MENATKALLIAAAILVAIVIISIGMVVLNQGTGTTEQAGEAMSSAEITAFNQTFLNYTGNSVTGNQLYELYKKVIDSNNNEKATGEQRYITLNIDTKDTSNKATVDNNTTSALAQGSCGWAVKSIMYRVTYDTYNSGVVKSITATEK